VVWVTLATCGLHAGNMKFNKQDEEWITIIIIHLCIKQPTRCIKYPKLRHKTLHVSVIFCAHHQELSTVHTATGMFHVGYVTAS
jgi:hypothetical protein